MQTGTESGGFGAMRKEDYMFTNSQRQEERTGKYGTSRVQYLQLSVIELLLDCLTEPSEKLVEFGIGGICNACAGKIKAFGIYAALVTQNEGIPLVIRCLSSPVRNMASDIAPLIELGQFFNVWHPMNFCYFRLNPE
ncbi:putative armadillo repeat-containing protein 7-like isoform 2 [Capsicum annuum]|nr:putative armadillo repeat-containing protein 7-like isoform 2 [Capsicum annuum]